MNEHEFSHQAVILIPAYQPENALLQLIEKLRAYHKERKIIIVDDGSNTPESHKIFQQLSQIPEISLIKHPHNLGKGDALKSGFQYFLQHFPDSIGIITADADGQHLAEDIEKISQAFSSSPNALVIGTREFSENIPWKSRFGNLLTRKIFQWFSGTALQDTQTGLRAIPRQQLNGLLSISAHGYAFETDVLLHLIKQKIRIREVPISTVYIENNRTSHFNPLLDSLKIYFVFIRYSLLSILSACIDFGLFFISFYFSKQILFSTVFARVISGVFNFTYSKKLIFKSNGHYIKEAVGYLALALTSMMASYVLVSFCYHYLKLNIFFSKFFSDSLIFIGNFIIQHRVIFKPVVKQNPK